MKDKTAATPENTTPTTPEATGRKPRGPNVLAGKSVKLVHNNKTGNYDMHFGDRKYQIRFQSPEANPVLANPLAGGMNHQSGPHSFYLSFIGDKLTLVTNLSSDTVEGETAEPVASVSVKLDSPLIQWIRVVTELSVDKALRLK